MAASLINSAPEVAYSKNPIAIKMHTSTSLATANLKLVLQLWVEKVFLSGTYYLVHTQELPPDSSGNATFYINEILDSFFVDETMPTFNQNLPTACETISKRYFYKYAEKSGDPPVLGSLITSSNPPRVVFNGGVSFEAYRELAYFTSYLPLKKSFLTWELNNKKITTSQQEFLYYPLFFNPSILTSPIVYKIKAYFTDGTNTTIYRDLPLTFFNRKWTVFVLPAGYFQLAIADISPSKTVSKYDLWLEWGSPSNIVSEVRTFIIDNKYYNRTRYFLYNNSLGGVSTLRATGNAKTKVDISKSILNKFVSFDYNPANGSRKANNSNEVVSVTCSTGFKTKQEVDRLRDMLLSDTVKEAITGMFLPIIINKYSAQIYQDTDDLWYLTFDYERAYDNVSYSPDTDELGLISGDFNNDFSDDFFINHV